jgi:hypothetical protein
VLFRFPGTGDSEADSRVMPARVVARLLALLAVAALASADWPSPFSRNLYLPEPPAPPLTGRDVWTLQASPLAGQCGAARAQARAPPAAPAPALAVRVHRRCAHHVRLRRRHRGAALSLRRRGVTGRAPCARGRRPWRPSSRATAWCRTASSASRRRSCCCSSTNAMGATAAAPHPAQPRRPRRLRQVRLGAAASLGLRQLQLLCAPLCAREPGR